MLAVYTYTADQDRSIFFRLFLGAIHGGGNYSVYLTVQRLGALPVYPMNPVTTVAVAAVSSGVLGFSTIAIPVKATDVVKVFVLGVSSDTGANVFTEVWDDCLPNLAPGAGGVPLADTNGKVSVNNLPADYLSAAEQTALTAASTGTWALGPTNLGPVEREDSEQPLGGHEWKGRGQ